MIYAIYARKSVESAKGESIENQIQECRQYIASISSDDSIIQIYRDEGFSGKNLNRPQFQRMAADAKKGTFQCIVCYRLDRISRNVSDFASLIEALNTYGIGFICIKEKFDTTNPMGKAMMYIASVFAQLERETIAERVRDNMEMLARSGRWLGGSTPYGYSAKKIIEKQENGRKKSFCSLVLVPQEYATIQTMFQQFLKTKSITKVQKVFNSRAIKSRNGNAFSAFAIHEILRNPVYCRADQAAWDYFSERQAELCFSEKDCISEYGLLCYKKRDYKKKNVPRRPVAEWIIAIGRHKSAVDGASWTQVQKLLDLQKAAARNPIHNSYALLSGQIFCASCQSPMCAKMHSKFQENGLYYYICTKKLHEKKALCSIENLGGIQTDQAILQKTLESVTESASLITILQAFQTEFENVPSQKRITEINQQIQLALQKVDACFQLSLDTYTSDAIKKRLSHKMKQADLHLKHLEEERKALIQTGKFILMEESELASHTYHLADFCSLLLDSPIETKRDFLKKTVKKIEWDGTFLHLYFFSALLP